MLCSQLSSERCALLFDFMRSHATLVFELIAQLQHGHLHLPQLLPNFVAHDHARWRRINTTTYRAPGSTGTRGSAAVCDAVTTAVATVIIVTFLVLASRLVAEPA
jgi:hypothetical protein